jgi:pimeloyl-ACP methyl ester carboxylesterase
MRRCSVLVPAEPVTEDLLDVRPEDPRWGHRQGPGIEDVRLHYVRMGSGPPVVLLHGWPGFWYDWRRVLPRIAGEADALAPDLRGFGGSDKPDRPPEEAYTPMALAADIGTLLGHLGLSGVVVVAHDIGATVAQALAMGAPDVVRALVLLNPPYLGIGRRRFEYPIQREHWYQHFHVQPWSDRLVGYNRDTVGIYLSHFYDHWVGRKETVRPAELEAIVDEYVKPEAVRAGFNYYRARWLTRQQEFGAQQPDPAELAIDVPTVVLWGEKDPVIPVDWSDRISEFFPKATLRRLPGVGHFVPFEAPDEVVEAIREVL